MLSGANLVYIYFIDNKEILIAGSVGPYGAYLHDLSEYDGRYIDHVPVATLKEFHQSRIEALVEGGVDLLGIETIPSKKEADIILEIVKGFPNLKAWLSFSCKVSIRLCLYPNDIERRHNLYFHNIFVHFYRVKRHEHIKFE